MNTAGGIAGGDRLEVAVTALADATVTVTSQAAERVYRALTKPALIDTRLKLSESAKLAWLPQETIAAEAILHDMGALSIMSSDSQAMGRVGEAIIRSWQTADKMKKQFGQLSEGRDNNDNLRARRYVAKYTLNPAIAQGVSTYVGPIERGKPADMCVWGPAFFGVKPDIVLKSGAIAAAIIGDPSGSIPTPQPQYYRPMFAAFGRCRTECSATFVSRAGVERAKRLGLARQVLPVMNTRTIGKRSMLLNDAVPRMEVNPETYEVRANGRLLTCEPARVLRMAQRYFMH